MRCPSPSEPHHKPQGNPLLTDKPIELVRAVHVPLGRCKSITTHMQECPAHQEGHFPLPLEQAFTPCHLCKPGGWAPS
eukprot:1150113-Pelagomonas_calceolata.AAC.3